MSQGVSRGVRQSYIVLPRATRASKYIPVGAERAALLLAAYYRPLGGGKNVARVIRVYCDAIIRLEGSAAATVCVHALQTLHGQLLHFRLRADADALNDRIRVARIASTAEMKPITVERSIPRAEVEKFVEGVLMGNAKEVLVRIALEFLPRRAQLVPALLHLQESAVLLAMMTKSITDSFCRTVAAVGPASTNPEGRYIDYLSLHFGLSVPWLREIMRRGLDGHTSPAADAAQTVATAPRFSRDDVLGHLFASPCFSSERRPLLEAAIDAYLRGDAVVAIHLLVPQIEQRSGKLRSWSARRFTRHGRVVG